MSLDSRNFWNQAWPQYIQGYVNTIPRQAYYLYFLLHKLNFVNSQDILELGAGSYRDTVKLNEWNYNCKGVDFSADAYALACQNYPKYQQNFYCEDALNLPFENKTFEITFHNGFLVCFQDDKTLDLLLKEQVRVTQKAIICTVHNYKNKKLRQIFLEKSQKEDFYKIRFFQEEELMQIMKPYFTSIEVMPFGYPVFDILMSKIKNKDILNFIYQVSYKIWNIEKCERLMFIGYLP